MSPHANTEDQLVEQPAIQLFAAMGWETVSALDEVMGPTGTLGRETTAEVALVFRLRAALERLNPTVPPEALAIAIESLARNRSTMSLVAANREVFLAHERWANTLYQAVKPDPAVAQFSARVGVIRVIGDAIRERTGEEPADITPVMTEINALLVRADRRMPFLQRRRQIGAPYSVRFSHGGARLTDQFIPRCTSAGDGVPFGDSVRKEALDVSLGLARGAVQVEAQHVEHAQERPDVRCRDGLAFEVADGFL